MKAWVAAAWCVVFAACRCGANDAPRTASGECAPRDGEVRIALAALPNTLDWNASSQSSAENYPVIHAMMRGLTALDEKNDVVPALASSWEVSLTADSPPKQRYIFHLRPDVVWSDGNTFLSARDFVSGWRRALLGNEPAEMGDIEGAPEVLAARAAPGTPEEVQGKVEAALEHFAVRALDEHTLEVVLRSPRSYFLARLANVYPFFPAPTKDLEGKTPEQIRRYFNQPANGKPMVLGAFLVKSWDKLGKTVRLVANPHDVFAPTSGRVNRLLLVEAALAPILYEQCKIDFLLMDDPSTLASAPADLAHSELESTYFLGMNASLVPLPLRQAIAHAIDRPSLTRGLLPSTRVASSYLPPPMPGSVAADDAAHRPQRDLKETARLLAEAGYHGEELTLLVRNSKTFLPERGVAQALRQQLAEAGIRVRVVETSNFASDIQTPDGRPRHPLFLKRVGADYAHPQTMFTPFEADGINYTDFQKLNGGEELAHFQGLLDEGATEMDFGRMRETYGEADEMLVEKDAVLVPLFHPDRYFRRRPWIEGLGIDAFNFLTLRSMRLRADAVTEK